MKKRQKNRIKPPTISLPLDFSACERGNIWLMTEDGAHNAWFRLSGNVWLFVRVCIEDYPGFEVDIVIRTDKSLAAKIQKECVGMHARRLNIQGVKLDKNNCVADLEEASNEHAL